MTPEECQHVNRDPKYPAACMDCGYLVDNPTVEVTPWTTEGDEDDAPWFDPPEPEPVPTVTKVAYLIPVTQQMLDDMPNPNIADLFRQQWQMAELHREQYHPHRLDYQRIQWDEMRQQQRRQTLRTFIPKSRRRPGARMTPGTWIPVPVPVPSPANRVDVHYAWVTNGVLRIQDVSVTTDTTLPGTEVRVRHVLDDLIDDLPGMWERADFEGGETDV